MMYIYSNKITYILNKTIFIKIFIFFFSNRASSIKLSKINNDYFPQKDIQKRPFINRNYIKHIYLFNLRIIFIIL